MADILGPGDGTIFVKDGKIVLATAACIGACCCPTDCTSCASSFLATFADIVVEQEHGITGVLEQYALNDSIAVPLLSGTCIWRAQNIFQGLGIFFESVSGDAEDQPVHTVEIRCRNDTDPRGWEVLINAIGFATLTYIKSPPAACPPTTTYPFGTFASASATLVDSGTVTIS